MQEARVAELQKAVLHAEDAAMETEREFHDFRLNHDALLEHCAHVLTVFASELRGAGAVSRVWL